MQSGYRYIPFSLFGNPNESFHAIYYNKLSKLRNKSRQEAVCFTVTGYLLPAIKMAAYWNFDGDKHLVHNLREQYYDPMKPLILSFDFNVNPYISCLPIQIILIIRFVYVFPEYVGYPKR